MLPFNQPAISLKVYAKEIFGVTDFTAFREEIEKGFSEKLGTIVTVLDRGRAIAINATNTPGILGPDPTTLKDLDRARELFRYVLDVGHLDLGYALMRIALPDTKYRVFFHFPREELGHELETKEKESWDDCKFVEVVFVYNSTVTASTGKLLQDLVDGWYAEACSVGFGKEKLIKGEVKFAFVDSACSFRILYPERVTYPWLELYLRVRSDLKGRCRPNTIHFRKDKRVINGSVLAIDKLKVLRPENESR